MNNAKLHNADLRGVDLQGSILHHANLVDVQLSNTNFSDTIFNKDTLPIVDGIILGDTTTYDYREKVVDVLETMNHELREHVFDKNRQYKKIWDDMN